MAGKVVAVGPAGKEALVRAGGTNAAPVLGSSVSTVTCLRTRSCIIVLGARVAKVCWHVWEEEGVRWRQITMRKLWIRVDGEMNIEDIKDRALHGVAWC